jgi:hypothetical protein
MFNVLRSEFDEKIHFSHREGREGGADFKLQTSVWESVSVR